MLNAICILRWARISLPILHIENVTSFAKSSNFNWNELHEHKCIYLLWLALLNQLHIIIGMLRSIVHVMIRYDTWFCYFLCWASVNQKRISSLEEFRHIHRCYIWSFWSWLSDWNVLYLSWQLTLTDCIWLFVHSLNWNSDWFNFISKDFPITLLEILLVQWNTGQIQRVCQTSSSSSFISISLKCMKLNSTNPKSFHFEHFWWALISKYHNFRVDFKSNQWLVLYLIHWEINV